jgi:16S rRNA (guanine527-N7)-methyltransferase
MDIADSTERFRHALASHCESFGVQLSHDIVERLCDYLLLINKWNPRLHLVAPCPPEEFATRHILESLLLVDQLTPAATIADIGSGAGLPIIPTLIARSDVAATLIESSSKKAVFLREALKETGTTAHARVVVERFEEFAAPQIDFVTCRALDNFLTLLPTIVTWAPRNSVLVLFGGAALAAALDELHLSYSQQLIPFSERRYLFTVRHNR